MFLFWYKLIGKHVQAFLSVGVVIKYYGGFSYGEIRIIEAHVGEECNRMEVVESDQLCGNKNQSGLFDL